MPKKQTEWTRAYNEKAYDRLAITVPKGQKAAIETHLTQHPEKEKSINGLVNRLLQDELGLTDEQWKNPQ